MARIACGKTGSRGVSLGVWENDYNNTIAGWRDWVYPEFKGFFAGVRWLQLGTTEGLITVLNNQDVPFVQVLQAGISAADAGRQGRRARACLWPGLSGRHSAHRQQIQGGPGGRSPRPAQRGRG